MKDREPGLRVLDLRGADAFETYHIPGAERVSPESLAATPFQSNETLVLYSGASEVAFGLRAAAIEKRLHDIGADFSVERFASCLGSAVGAVRVSVGLANNTEDIRRAVDVVASFRE